MKTKFTLSVNDKIIQKAKELAQKDDTTISEMFSTFIQNRADIQKKLVSLEKVSGAISSEIVAEDGEHYRDHLHKKHGW